MCRISEKTTIDERREKRSSDLISLELYPTRRNSSLLYEFPIICIIYSSLSITCRRCFQ